MWERSGGRAGQRKAYALEQNSRWNEQDASAAAQGSPKVNGLIKKARVDIDHHVGSVLRTDRNPPDHYRHYRRLRPAPCFVLHPAGPTKQALEEDIQPAGHCDFAAAAASLSFFKFSQSA